MPHHTAESDDTSPPRAEPPARNVLPSNVRLLGLSSLLNDVASEMMYPLMPQFLLGVLGGNRFHLGVIEGVADSIASLLKLWSGAWSDRVRHRKLFVLVGYLLAAIARPFIGLAGVPWHLFAARTADRLGKGIRTAPRDALIAESTDPAIHGRAFGFHRAMDHLGAAIGPVLASLFLYFWPGQLRSLFLLTLVPGILVVSLVALGLRETAVAPQSPTNHPTNAIGFFQFGRSFQIYMFAIFVFTLGNSSDSFLLVRAGELGVPTVALPLLWCVFHIVKSLGNLWAGRIVDRVGPKPVILIGWVMYGFNYLMFAVIDQAWQAWVAFLSYGLCYSVIEPAEKTMVTTIAGSERKGLAFGWFNFALGVAALPSSLIFGWLYQQFGSIVAFGFSTTLAVVAAILLTAVRPTTNNTAMNKCGNSKYGERIKRRMDP